MFSPEAQTGAAAWNDQRRRHRVSRIDFGNTFFPVTTLSQSLVSNKQQNIVSNMASDRQSQSTAERYQ